MQIILPATGGWSSNYSWLDTASRWISYTRKNNGGGRRQSRCWSTRTTDRREKVSRQQVIRLRKNYVEKRVTRRLYECADDKKRKRRWVIESTMATTTFADERHWSLRTNEYTATKGNISKTKITSATKNYNGVNVHPKNFNCVFYSQWRNN